MYSIVDIEATGGNAAIGKMTEIAIYRFNGKEIVDQYASLINPEMNIPRYVQKLTGIDNKMARDAPLFCEIASTVHAMLSDSIFVGHNVKADYSFVKSAFDKCGIDYTAKRLCTLEWSKKVILDAPSHGLEKITDHLNINVENRHRAAGDALATVELFKYLKKTDDQNWIERLIRKV